MTLISISNLSEINTRSVQKVSLILNFHWLHIFTLSLVGTHVSHLRRQFQPLRMFISCTSLARLRSLPIQKKWIKFCEKNKIKCASAQRMLSVGYGEANLNRSNIYQWYYTFSDGRENVNDEKRVGHSSTSIEENCISQLSNNHQKSC